MRTLEERFGKWYPFAQTQLEQDYFKKLGRAISGLRTQHEVYPEADKVFRAYELTDPSSVKVVWLGQDPYPQWSAWTNKPIADGLCFSASDEDKIPPSLLKIHKAIEDDCYSGFYLNTPNDLAYLAAQGVLLLNSCLTVTKNSPNSHAQLGWETFIGNSLQYLFSFNNPLYIITFGAPAKKLVSTLPNRENVVYSHVEHPAYALRNHREMDHQNAFSSCNKFIKHWYNESILWFPD